MLTNTAVAEKQDVLDANRAELVIEFIEAYLRVPEGKFVGKRIVLREWQKDFVRAVYEPGVQQVIFTMARKNAKTTLIAMLIAAHLVGPVAVPNSSIYSAAQSRDQAAVVFNLLRKMILQDDDLTQLTRITESGKIIKCPDMGIEYKALSAEAKNIHGLSPIFVVHDELGQVTGPTDPVYEALETAMGAQEHPLSVIISTQARRNDDLLSQLIDDALKAEDPTTRIIMYATDVTDDPWDEKTWHKANPALGDFRSIEDVRRLAMRAKRMPAQENSFRNLILNQRVAAHSVLFSPSVWNAGGRPVNDKLFYEQPVYGGLDLSSRQDLTCLALTARDPETDEIHIRLDTWTPAATLDDRAAGDRQPYRVWVDQGYLTETGGKSIKYDDIAEHIAYLNKTMNLVYVNFDRWRIDVMKDALTRVAGGSAVDLRQFGQGYQSMSPAIDELESLGLREKLVHGNNPVLTMCAANAVVISDPSGNRKFDKSKSTARIDGLVALVMSVAGHISEKEAPFDIDAMIG